LVTHGIESDAYAIQIAKEVPCNAEERDGKLYFKGTVATDARRTRFGTPSRPFHLADVVADIQVTGGQRRCGATST
jgi:hypothetical protein